MRKNSCTVVQVHEVDTCSDRWLIIVLCSALWGEREVMVNNCCVVGCTNCVGRASVSTVSLQPDKGQTLICLTFRGGVAGPAGPALAGPLFSGSLVSCPDCRDGLRTRRLGQVSHASSPLPCVYAFLVIVPALLPADQDPGAARPDCIGTHVLLNTPGHTTCSC